MPFHHTQLDNGLEIIAETSTSVQSVALGFFVKAGSRDESADVHGVSHFLEHMAFKGTDKFSAEDVNRIFDEIGADYNAATSEETTLFYAAVLPEYLSTAFEVQAAILQPALRDSDFDTEKQVILEEIGMYDDQPSIVAYDRLMQTHFEGHPLGRTILGTTESVTRLTSAQMRAYHQDHYRSGNIVLAVAGNVAWDEIRQLAEQHCQNWPAGQSDRRTQTPRSTGGRTMILREALQQEQVMQLIPAPDGNDPLRFAAELLAVIVGDDHNSRLFWEIVDPGAGDLAELNYNDFQDAGTFLVYLSGDPEETEANLERAERVFAAVNAECVTDEELQLAKTKVSSRIVLRGERPMGRLSSLGGEWVSRGEYRTIAEDLKLVNSITQQDLRRLLDQFPLKPVTTVGIGPKQEV